MEGEQTRTALIFIVSQIFSLTRKLIFPPNQILPTPNSTMQMPKLAKGPNDPMIVSDFPVKPRPVLLVKVEICDNDTIHLELKIDIFS